MEYSIKPIAYIKTPFSQKFAIPRQGLSLSIAKGQIEFTAEINQVQATSGIDAFSHLWILFLFHENIAKGFKDKVRPPRLGGNKKVGVLATRSSFRPNHIGMSLVQNLGMKDGSLHVSGVDLMNGTPIIDIKPYIGYADLAPNAVSAYANNAPSKTLTLAFDEHIAQSIKVCEKQYPDFLSLLTCVLEQDPRPAYKKGHADEKEYAITLYDIDIHWKVVKNQAFVLKIDI